MAVRQDQRLPQPLQVEAARQGQPQPSVEKKPHPLPAKPDRVAAEAWAHQVAARPLPATRVKPLPEEAATRPELSAEQTHLLPAKPVPHPEAVAAPLRRVATARPLQVVALPLSAVGAEPLQVEAAAWAPQAVVVQTPPMGPVHHAMAGQPRPAGAEA